MVSHLLALTFALTTTLIASILLPAHAQTAESRTPRSDPADAQAAVPTTVYRSTLSAFRAKPGEVLSPWREANDRVGSIGGWRVYAREAQQPAATAVPSPAPTTGTPQPKR